MSSPAYMPSRKRFMLFAVGVAVLLGITLVLLSPDHRVPLLSRLAQAARFPLERVQIPAKGEAPAQSARMVIAPVRSPLIVDLHNWSGTDRELSGIPEPLVEAVRRKGWNYIRPALLGPNGTPDGCCGSRVIAAIEAAIDFAATSAPVDRDAVFLVGESGGGYTALCALMSGRIPARGVFTWAAISDLVAWHSEPAGVRYAADIRACTRSGPTLDETEARRRSPLHMPMQTNGHRPPLKLYAGVHDGWTGSVPITHSIRMFNRFAAERWPDGVVDEATVRQLVEQRSLAGAAYTPIAGRKVHLRRAVDGAELSIFEGGHEMLTDIVIADIEAALAAGKR